MATATTGPKAGTTKIRKSGRLNVRVVAVTGAVLVSGLALTGCGVSNLVGPESHSEVQYDVSDAVTALNVSSGAGDIEVVESARTGILVTEVMNWRGEDSNKPKTEHPVDGGTLSLKYSCEPGGLSCGVDYRVEIPHGLDVRTDAGSGGITLRALSGGIDVQTGSGDIDGSELSGKKLVGQTGSGEIEVRFTTVPDSVDIHTGSGAGIVRLPQGTYDVTTETGSGEEQVDVTKDSSSPRKIIVKTGSGDAKVLTPAGA